MPSKKFKLGLPAQVLIGAILGIFIGLFFGDYCTVFRPIGTIYTMLLQAVVYPLLPLICTLLTGLGRLTPETGFLLFKRTWVIYVFLMILTFGVIIVLSSRFPLAVFNFKLQEHLLVIPLVF